MSGISGFPSSQKVDLGTGKTNTFATVIPTDENRNALDVGRFVFRVGSPTVPRIAGAQTNIVNEDGHIRFVVEDTATPARRGDIIRFEDGNASFIEFPIVNVSANFILISVNQGKLPAAGDSFFILRHATQRVGQDGAQMVIAEPGPSQFVLDGNPVQVEESTTDPADSAPFPVKPLARLIASTFLDCSDDNLDNGTPVEIMTTTQYASEIEVVNSTAIPLELLINAQSIYMGGDGLKRQAIAIPAGAVIAVKTIQNITADSGIVAVNLFY